MTRTIHDGSSRCDCDGCRVADPARGTSTDPQRRPTPLINRPPTLSLCQRVLRTAVEVSFDLGEID